MISDIATNAWLIDFCHKAIKPWGLRSLSRNFMADIRISLRNIGGQSMQWWAIHSQGNFYLTCSRNLVAFVIYMDLSLGLSILKLIASCDGCHVWSRRRLLNLEHLVVLLAGPISHTSTRCMDFVEIFNIILDLSITCFSHFSGCWASFMFIVITLSWNAITCFLESSWVWDRFLLLLLLLGPRWIDIHLKVESSATDNWRDPGSMQSF